MAQETVIMLHRSFFSDRERKIAELGELSASLFLYDSGVAALRMENARGQVTILPFQGQQIWDARFDDRVLAMKSMFTQPHPTREYLATYGGFLIHCGATAMGVPTKEDSHPLHGELPNAPYDSAFLAIGSDERGPYFALGGEYRHTVAFNFDYLARPRVKLHAGESLLPVSLEIVNCKKTPMDLMYLAHVNFRPLDNGRLVYTAPCTPQTVRVRTALPSHIKPPAGHREFLSQLAANPGLHNVLAPGLAFDPEVVLYLGYRTDTQGWAHSMMVHPDGWASYIRHRPDQLDHGVRWISRTADQDCLGIVLPATAEPEGYTAEKAKGNVRSLAGGATARFDLEVGLLAPARAKEMETAIEHILAGR
ncbi:MAG TPA: DUF4432 family protein [Spirochaetia bacterium]|nr:DUF4432 family protein [Spirochaetia bacterium]